MIAGNHFFITHTWPYHRINTCITINNDLNPYSFLITYIHEVAHLATFRDHGRSVAPHGREWKQNFVKGLKPVMKPTIFPSAVLDALDKHLTNPKATSCSDPVLYEVLRSFDERKEGETTLRHVAPGEQFVFQNQTYQKVEKRRTRALCVLVENNRKYLIPEIATVLKISP